MVASWMPRRRTICDCKQSLGDALPIVYGLGEIAWRKQNTNDAIHYYQLYLTHANTNSAEAMAIVKRLKTLKP